MKHLFVFVLLLFASAAWCSPHTRLYAVAISNDDPKAFMGGSSLGSGLYVSDDTGTTWTHLGWTHLKAYSVDIVGKTIYLATGEGILVSTDGGTRFSIADGSDLAIPHPFEVMDISHDPHKPGSMLAATTRGILRLDKKGRWSMISGDSVPKFSSRVLFDTVVSGHAIAATERGLYRTNNGGATWSTIGGTSHAITALIQVDGADWFATTRGGAILSSHDSAKTFAPNSAESNAIASRDGEPDSLWAIAGRPPCFVGGPDGLGPQNHELQFVDGGAIEGSPRNVSAICVIGNWVLVGSLGDGVYKGNAFQHEALLSMKPSGLEHKQIWTLKAMEVNQ